MSGTRVGASIASKVQQFIFRLFFRDHKALFTYYYKTNKWGDGESVSGPGSSLVATENIRRELPLLFREFNIEVLFDAPCGDFNWFRKVDFHPNMKYIGGEIVEAVVINNQNLYRDDQRSFIKVDIIKDELPQADMWFCRDTLFHFSNGDIMKVISNLKRSNIKYFLSTTFPETEVNVDIMTGEYRPVNLEIDPFYLSNPLRYIQDSGLGIKGKMLGLWKI